MKQSRLSVFVAWALAALMAFPPFAFAQTAQAGFINVSTNNTVPANGSFTIGFVVGGTVKRKVLVRAVGPALLKFGVTNANPDPFLEVYRGQTLIVSNDDWQMQSSLNGRFLVEPAEIVSAATQAGAFPLDAGSWDAATILTLDPGPYTMKVSGGRGDAGAILAEAYILP